MKDGDKLTMVKCPACGFRATVMSWMLMLWNKEYRQRVLKDLKRKGVHP